MKNLLKAAHLYDQQQKYLQADVIDSLLLKIAKNKPAKIYHYTDDKKHAKRIEEKGLCAPSVLVEDPDMFEHVRENYRERIAKVYDDEPTDEVVLDYLDYSRALMLDKFHGGRNMIFFLFDEVPPGISKAHDRFAKLPLFSLDINKLSKALKEDVEFVVVELPLVPEEDATRQIEPEEVANLSGKDMFQFYDRAKADDLLFATVPHLAVWIKDGHIPTKFLERLH